MLTNPQRRALQQRQTSLVGRDCIFGPGTTLAALRRRGLVAGRQPFAELTPEGEQLAQQIDTEGQHSE